MIFDDDDDDDDDDMIVDFEAIKYDEEEEEEEEEDFCIEDFDPFIAEQRKARNLIVTGDGARQERAALLFAPPSELHLGGVRPQSPSQAELDVVQQILQAENGEAREAFEWAAKQLPSYGKTNMKAIRFLLTMPWSTATLALFRAGFLVILANCQKIRRVASSGYVAGRVYHNIPERDMHTFFKSKWMTEAKRQYVILANGTGTISDTKAARSVLFVNQVRNMVQRGGVEGYVAQLVVPQQQ